MKIKYIDLRRENWHKKMTNLIGNEMIYAVVVVILFLK